MRIASLQGRRVIVAAAVALGAGTAFAGKAIPHEALAVVAKVRSAAAKPDFAMLRSSMANEFTWSFGGDADAEQAIARWKTDRQYTKSLVNATRSECGWIANGIVQCPAKAGHAFRAGFKQLDGSWKMIYFVAGD